MHATPVSADGQSIRLIPLSEVMRLTGRGRSNIYAGVRAGTFCKPVKDGTSTRWILSEVEQWLRDRIAERDAKVVA